jgi:mannan endo-1,4-beta-mannosidase
MPLERRKGSPRTLIQLETEVVMKVLAALSLTGLVSAQVAPYGQCGGSGYTGSTVCTTGWACQYQNDWYSQCLAGKCCPTFASNVQPLTFAASNGGTTTTLTTKASTTSISTTKTTSTTTKTTSTTTSSTGGTGFPTTNGLKFEIDGKTSYFAGSNSYWIGFLTNNADVDTVLDHMDESGLRILRVWGFNDVNTIPSSGTVYYQLLSGGQATINTGADGLQRLDYVVAAAEKRNVKLIINFVNNWSDYGGMAAYVTAFGGSQTTWYTNTAAQTAYRAYVKAVVSRYINSPAIFAWELANEPRCNGCNPSVLYEWISSTSAYIKSLDSKHMVAIGDGE